MENYNHIQIERQEVSPVYRGRPNPTAPRPPQRERMHHGQKLKTELSQASSSILAARHESGIQTDNLMVLEISSEALSSDVLEVLLSRFQLSLVDETPEFGTDRSKLVVQFENQAAINQFNSERALWEAGAQEEGILTYAKRRDLFNCIDTIRSMTREDRIGKKLKEFTKGITADTGFFVVNIDVWYNNDRTKILEIERQIRQVLGTQGSQLLGDLFEITGLLLGRARVNEFSLNALLNMDIICSVELPFEAVSQEPFDLYQVDYIPIVNDTLSEDAPLAAVLDSGVFTGNPLLRNVVVAEEDFDTTENTPTDTNGHGTAVAGIVVYGSFNNLIETRVFTPLVRICNGKVMHNDEMGNPCFREDVRPEKIVRDAITFFYEKYGCRVFNLSAGNADSLYNGGRQFPWASMLDDLSRELDIVIIVSAGNVCFPEIKDFATRDELMQNARDQLFSPEHRLIDPATSALSITVGSISRSSEPAIPRGAAANRISVGLTEYPSVFTRIGKGVNKSIKPDFVDYGGNYAIHQISRGNNRWLMTDQNLMEPTLNHTTEKVFKGYCGTSFSAPHVTHMAARLERALEKQLHEKPSANLIRAMLANSARCSESMKEWGMASKDMCYTGRDNPKQERLMRLNGYGVVTDSLLSSTDNTVTLFAEDRLPLRDFHLYRIPVPQRFLNVKASKSITVSLAYNPMTRSSRKEYLANNLWIEIFRRIDEETLIKYKAKKEAGTDTEDDFKKLPNSFKTDFVPGYDALQKSTLQQRRWQKSSRGGADLSWDNGDEPYIYILVSGKERFKYAEQEQPQSYALCVTFAYESEENIDLYSQLRNNVKLKVIERVPARIRV